MATPGRPRPEEAKARDASPGQTAPGQTAPGGPKPVKTGVVEIGGDPACWAHLDNDQFTDYAWKRDDDCESAVVNGDDGECDGG